MTSQTHGLGGLGRFLAFLILVIGLGATPLALPTTAQPIPDRDITEPPEASSCPVDRSTDPAITEVPEDGFSDVPPDNLHEFAVDCVVWYGLASGTSSTTYEPDAPVSRGQMASFIARLVDYASDADNAGPDGPGQPLPEAPPGSYFLCDVSASGVHSGNIQRLAAAGIVQGTGSSDNGQACFDPGGAVTRGQMASFIKGARDYIDNTSRFVADANVFVDDDGNVHEDDINAIAVDGITQGTGVNDDGGRLYSPGLDVKRDQMGSFLARALDIMVVEGTIKPPSTL